MPHTLLIVNSIINERRSNYPARNRRFHPIDSTTGSRLELQNVGRRNTKSLFEQKEKKKRKGRLTARGVCGMRFFSLLCIGSCYSTDRSRARHFIITTAFSLLRNTRPSYDRRFLVFIDRPTHELSACFRDTISSGIRHSCESNDYDWLCWPSYGFRYTSRLHLYSYLLNNVVTLRIQRIINMVRNVNWYQGIYAVRRYITVDMYSVLQDVSFSS